MHKIFRWLTIIIIFSLLMGMTGQSTPAADAAVWQAKVDPWILAAAEDGETEILVFMREQADLREAATLESKSAKGAYVYEALTSIAESTQKPVRAALDSLGVAYQPYWVVNALWVRGDLHIIQEIAQRPDVAHVYANPQVQLSLPEQADAPAGPLSPEAIEWNITKINADDVWGAGFTGQGVVIGGQDTGYDWDHPAIKDQYRGWNGATADHNYNWHDSTGGSPNTPADPHGHGTHTMGTMAGDDGGSNQIGVAPGARWIGCRNMDSGGNGTPTTYIECYQWFVAPTDLSGNNPNPAMAPDVINNSWGCPASEGCTDPGVLLAAVQNLRAAGIVTAHSAGNSGSSCSTISTPAAIYAESFTVGATNSSDTIASFSSRGPVTVDGSNRWKPNISAPGVSIRSCTSGGGYASWQGTSMAAPHIAGVVALLISAKPALAGQVDVLETLIEETALALYTTQGCGGDTPASHPNHTYGWGRVDAWAAFTSIEPDFELAVKKIVSPIMVAPGDTLTYTLIVTNTHAVSTTHNVILEDTIPTGTDFITATLPHTLTGGVITWALGDLTAGEMAQVQLIVQVPITTPGGTIVNTQYGVYSDEAPLVIGDPVYAYIHMLSVEKSAPEAVTPGSLLQYTLEVTNLQPDVATHHVILQDVIPTDTNFITATLPHTLTGDILTWAIGDLAAEETAQVELIVQIPITTPLGTIVNNQYSAYSDEASLVVGDPVSTTIHMLTVEKSAPEIVVRGFPITYTLTVTNLQPDVATHNVVLTDTLPVGTEFITATGSYSVNGDLVTWELGDLGAGISSTVDMVVQVPMTATGTITNALYGAVSDEVATPAKGETVSTLVQEPGVELSPGQSGLIMDPCDESSDLIYTHPITNTGNYTDTFAIILDSGQGWAHIDTEQVTLASEGIAFIGVELNPFCPTLPGTVDLTTITATSLADPSVTAIITDTTIIGYRLFFPVVPND